MRPDILVPVHEPTDVSAARREASKRASHVGLDARGAGALAVIVTEVASNQLKHAGGGEVIFRDVSGPGGPAVEVVAIDSGKGMHDVSRCFEDGFTTAGSPGNGLGAIARLSSAFDIYSREGKGTVLTATVGSLAGKDQQYEIAGISLPYPGETVCGDQWAFRFSPDDGFRILLADGLGHGTFAAQASEAALPSIDMGGSSGPVGVVEDAHLRLRSTRGAAIGVVDIDREIRNATFAGIGNVAGCIVTEGMPRRQMVSVNGTLGHEMRGARQYQYPLSERSLVVLHSDGLSTQWFTDKYPGLIHRGPSVIAGVLLRDFRRVRDDATVVVLRPRREKT